MFALEWGGRSNKDGSVPSSPTAELATTDSAPESHRDRSLAKRRKGKQHQQHHHHNRNHHHSQHHAHRHRRTASDGATQNSATGLTPSLPVALGAAAAYVTLRGGITVFHHVRRSLLRQMLIEVMPILERIQSCEATAAFSAHWLDFGSLLGVHRDGDLILHDNDVDIVVLDPDWNVLLQALAAALPQYNVRREIPSEAPDSQFLRVYCPLGFVDIFGAFASRLEDRGILHVDCGHGVEMNAVDMHLVLPTKQLQWRDVSLRVPSQTEAVLIQRYGQSWSTPRYMDKGADTIEGNKTYAKVFRALSKLGIRL